MENILYIPEVNPIIFYDITRSNIPAYFTKQFEKWMFEERLYDWQQPEHYCQVWQVDDIVNLQFESSFDPIIFKLLDSDLNPIIEQPMLIGLPNKFLPGTYSFEVQQALSGILTGCYFFQIEAGTGENKKILRSNCQFISEDQIPNTIRYEYWHNKKYHKDVLWVSGIKMQMRVHGHFGHLDKSRTDVAYRDQQWNPYLLSAKTAKQFPLYNGDEFGLPDDIYNILDHIWGCSNVLIDGVPYGLVNDSKVEIIDIDSLYPKRGFKFTIENGINRNSRIYAVNTDTTKKIMAQVMWDAKAFGDLANQGSSNAVPVLTEE